LDKEKNKKSPSRLGLWNKTYEGDIPQMMYHDVSTAKIAGQFLGQKDIVTVEDWGCGFGGFEQYIESHQSYIGIDGSQSQYAEKLVDLEHYTSTVDAIHMRHILEHNPAWESILINAISSFNKRMVLTIFTPFQLKTQVLQRYPNFNGTGVEMVDIGFCKDDLITHFSTVKWTLIENIYTQTQYNVEHVFFLEKDVETD